MKKGTHFKSGKANVKDFHSERNVIVLLFVSRNINRKRGWHDRYFRERIGRSRNIESRSRFVAFSTPIILSTEEQ